MISGVVVLGTEGVVVLGMKAVVNSSAVVVTAAEVAALFGAQVDEEGCWVGWLLGG